MSQPFFVTYGGGSKIGVKDDGSTFGGNKGIG
jgi:hypothetical protein